MFFDGIFPFSFFFILFFLLFGIFLVGFIIAMIRGIKTWHKNNKSPRLTVSARITSKRIDTSHGSAHGAHGHVHSTSSTWYYVTFEFESGDRQEFSVMGREYGLLSEGDSGKLTFQGTRYLSFERE